MIAERLAALRSELDAVCAACGRDPATVHLIAVSKTQPVDAIRAAYDAGQRDFGENYAQELRDKAAVLPADIRWHFIGRLQTNKAKYVAPVAARIHAVDDPAQAVALAARASGPLDVLVAVNVGDESTKGGVAPEAVAATVDAVSAVPGVRVVGLMCLPPPTDDPEASAPAFRCLAGLLAAEHARRPSLVELSMGMSHDWRVAVREGATWIRVGTAIFGPRVARGG